MNMCAEAMAMHIVFSLFSQVNATTQHNEDDVLFVMLKMYTQAQQPT